MTASMPAPPRGAAAPPVLSEAPTPVRFAGRGSRSVWLWAALGLGGMLCFTLGGEPGTPRSPLWFMELVLIGAFLTGLFINTKGTHLRRFRHPTGWAMAAYIGLAWLAGMMYELSLSEKEGSIGGCADTTGMSFILAQFAYLPLILFGLLAIRTRRLLFNDAFLFGGAASFAESLIFRPMLLLVIISPLFFLFPLVLGYYVLIYGIILSFPLLLIDEQALWMEATPGPMPIWKLILFGILAGFAAAFIFGSGGGLVGWALG